MEALVLRCPAGICTPALAKLGGSQDNGKVKFLQSLGGRNIIVKYSKSTRNERLCSTARAASTSEASSALASNVESAQETLLDAIAGIRGRGKGASKEQKDEVTEAVRILENDGGVPNPTSSELIEGRWQLLYTTRPGTASPIQRTFVGVDAFSVFQQISLTSSSTSSSSSPSSGAAATGGEGGAGAEQRVTNTVNFSEKIGELRVERIKFQFDRAAFYLKFWPYKLPYPVPFRLLGDEAKGWLDTTYLSPDGNLRISKGNKGTTFVLQKQLSARQRLMQAVKSKRSVEQGLWWAVRVEGWGSRVEAPSF
eukprot:jgi/Mesen1/6750/ME000344S06028